MSMRPVRIQGGVFLWACALCSVVASVFTIHRCYDGLGMIALTVLSSALTGYIVYKIWWRIIKRAGNSPQREGGPLVALSIAAAAMFAQGMYGGCASSVPGRIAVSVVMVSLFSPMCVFMARGLNQYDFRMSRQTFICEYSKLNSNAQYVCIVLTLLPLLSLLFTFAVFVFDGVNDHVIKGVGNLMIATVFNIVCMARMRVRILRWTGNWFSNFEEVEKDVAMLPFAFCEYVASFAGAGAVTLVFLAASGRLGWQYLCLIGAGLIVAVLVEMAFVRSDVNGIKERLRIIWRECLTRQILENQTEFLQRKRKKVYTKILEMIDIGEFDENIKDNGAIKRAEVLRRTLNYHCCESGKMKYITSCEGVPKGEIVKRMVEELLPGIAIGNELDEAACECVTDEDLKEFYHSVAVSPARIRVNAQDISSAYAQLRDIMGATEMSASARLCTVIVSPSGMRDVVIDVPGTGDVRILYKEQERFVPCENVVEHVESLF